MLDFPLMTDCSTTQRPISNEYVLYDRPFSTLLSIFIKAFPTGLGVMFSNEDAQYRYVNVIDLLVTPRGRPSFIDRQNMSSKGPGGRIIVTGRHFLSELDSIVKIVFVYPSVCHQIFGEIL